MIGPEKSSINDAGLFGDLPEPTDSKGEKRKLDNEDDTSRESKRIMQNSHHCHGNHLVQSKCYDH